MVDLNSSNTGVTKLFKYSFQVLCYVSSVQVNNYTIFIIMNYLYKIYDTIRLYYEKYYAVCTQKFTQNYAYL